MGIQAVPSRRVGFCYSWGRGGAGDRISIPKLCRLRRPGEDTKRQEVSGVVFFCVLFSSVCVVSLPSRIRPKRCCVYHSFFSCRPPSLSVGAVYLGKSIEKVQ